MPIKEFALLQERHPWDLELATCHHFHMQTLGATLSLSIVALCFYSLHGYRYSFNSSFFFYVHLKIGIWLCLSTFKTSKKTWVMALMMSGCSPYTRKKPPHLSPVTPAPFPMHPFIWLSNQRLKQCMYHSAGWCANRPATTSFQKE